MRRFGHIAVTWIRAFLSDPRLLMVQLCLPPGHNFSFFFLSPLHHCWLLSSRVTPTMPPFLRAGLRTAPNVFDLVILIRAFVYLTDLPSLSLPR